MYCNSNFLVSLFFLTVNFDNGTLLLKILFVSSEQFIICIELRLLEGSILIGEIDMIE